MLKRTFDPTRCSICNRHLDQPGDPLSLDCGGDCYGCMIRIEDARPASELPPDQLALWLDLRGEIVRALFASLEGPRLPPCVWIAEQERMVRGWVDRFQALGLGERAAGLLVRATVATVMCPGSPDA